MLTAFAPIFLIFTLNVQASPVTSAFLSFSEAKRLKNENRESYIKEVRKIFIANSEYKIDQALAKLYSQGPCKSKGQETCLEGLYGPEVCIPIGTPKAQTCEKMALPLNPEYFIDRQNHEAEWQNLMVKINFNCQKNLQAEIQCQKLSELKKRFQIASGQQ
jgi:hypothetical protein